MLPAFCFEKPEVGYKQMDKLMRMGLFGPILVLLTGFVASAGSATETRVTDTHCELQGITIEYDFPAAKVDGCYLNDKGAIVIQTAPEDEPINPSPWYAFRISAAEPQQVNIAIEALGRGMARYNPKASTDLQSWRDIEHVKENDIIYFSLAVGPTPYYVAGQEIFANRDYIRWLTSISELSGGTLFNLGQSAQQRPLPALVKQTQGNTEWLVLIGRQHPPELTGAMALRAFVAEVFSGSALSKQFLARYNVLLAPNLNPDGVALGNWRHSTGGGDLNRDWFDRTQPETTAVHNYLQAIVNSGEQLVYGVDFHSTWHNIYYTIPADYLEHESNFSAEWLQRLAAAVPYEVEEKAGTSPGRGIFKQYMADVYGIHSVTYEVGDETDRNEIAVTAQAAAKVLMQYMLERP